MNNSITRYRDNSDSIKELGKLYDLIITNFPLLQEQATEILRAQIVLIISSLDCYIHDCVKVGIIEIFQGSRDSSNATNSYPIEFLSLQQISNTTDFPTKLLFLEEAIKNKNAKDSYQSPKGIEYALNLINIERIWSNVSTAMEMPANDVKNKLSLIIDRRNKIAHEADRDSLTGSKISIDRALVDDVIAFIDKLAEAIFSLV